MFGSWRNARCLGSVLGSTLLLAGVLIAGPLAEPASAAVSPIKVSGTQLVTSTGTPVKILGVNRSGTEYACQQDGTIFLGPTDQAQMNLMRSWNINMVRIPLNEHCWLGTAGESATSGAVYRKAILDYVNRLNANNIYAVLDLHFTSPWGAWAEQRRFMANRTYSVPFWASVASTFKTNGGVMFELYNEPHDIDWNCWKNGCIAEGFQAAGMQEMLNAVRSAGATQPVILSGIDWGHDMRGILSYLPTDPANQLVAGQHLYNFKRCVTEACWSAEFRPVADAMPLLAPEVGSDNCSTALPDSFMKWMDANKGSGYGFWSFNAGPCPEGPQYGGSALIYDWNGTPTPYGTVVKNHYLSGANPVDPTCSAGQFKATYFNNVSLTGSPALTRCESSINYSYGTGGPGSPIGNDNFSARWVQSPTFSAGNYEFSVTGDDGIRLYLDGALVIDGWKDQAPTTYTAQRTLAAGAHEVKVEYYERTEGATAKASWKPVTNPSTSTTTSTTSVPPTGCTTGQFATSYFNNVTLTGAPALTRCENTIDDNYGSGGPGSPIGADNFSARWVQAASFTAGDYDFTVTGDDGIRLFLDGVLVVGEWKDQAPTTYSARRTVTTGTHEVKVEYYERSGGAVARASWAKAPSTTCTSAQFSASYFNNVMLSGTPVLTRCEAAINYEYGTGSPAPAVNVDNFSAIWTRSTSFAAGTYEFSLTTDDGVRLYIDGVLVLSEWRDQAPTTFTVRRTLTAATHQIRIEYYERTQGATAKASWRLV